MKKELQRALSRRQLLVYLPALALLLSVGRCTPPLRYRTNQQATENVYVGTYTRTEGHVDGKAAGIYRVQINTLAGTIGEPTLVAEVTNPSFVAATSDGRYVYAVSELAHDDEPTGYLHAFRAVNGNLRQIARLPTEGKAPCHVELDRLEHYAIVSNYVGGVAKVYAIDDQGGISAVDKFTVTEADKKGRDSWLHSANFSPDGRTVAICDKGLDKVWLFNFDHTTGRMEPAAQPSIDLEAGSGPRHAVWSQFGAYLYVINELGNTISVLARQSDELSAPLALIQTVSTLPEGYAGQSYCADIHLSPDGRFLYGSNRGHNSIAGFAVDQKSGLLTALGHTATEGEYPRNFAISPNGRYLFAANQNTSNIATFRIDPAKGSLIRTAQEYEIPTPVCLEFID